MTDHTDDLDAIRALVLDTEGDQHEREERRDHFFRTAQALAEMEAPDSNAAMAQYLSYWDRTIDDVSEDDLQTIRSIATLLLATANSIRDEGATNG